MFFGKVQTVRSVLECNQWFAPCCQPSVFTSMKALLIVGFVSDTPTVSGVFLTCPHAVKGFFLPRGKDSVIIRFNFLLWSPLPFDVFELSGVFLSF